jgi:hypothetical protein
MRNFRAGQKWSKFTDVECNLRRVNLAGDERRKMMRKIISVTGFCLMNLLATQAHSQAATETAKPVKPRVYALVAAVGAQFSFVHEVKSVGSHLPPYRRSTVDAPDNILNRIVLQSLDKAIVNIDPDSTRIYMSLAAAQMDKVAPSQREHVAISKIVSELEKMPQRLEWDRIVIVTPAYKLFDHNDMADRLQGLGVFTQPLTGMLDALNISPMPFESLSGPDAVTPEGKAVRVRTFLAPYSYIQVWVLDPKTFAVIDKRQGFDSQKLADPMSGSLDINQSVRKEFLAGRIISLIEQSVHEAVMQTELRGKVEVGELKQIKPNDAKK